MWRCNITRGAIDCSEWISDVRNPIWGCCLAQLIEQASHVQRLCPCYSGPRFDSRPGSLCCVSLPLPLILFPVTSSSELSIKAIKGQTKNKQTTDWTPCHRVVLWSPPKKHICGPWVKIILSHKIQFHVVFFFQLLTTTLSEELVGSILCPTRRGVLSPGLSTSAPNKA